MSVTLTGSSGALFNRFGRLAGAASDVVAIMGGTATARVLSGANMQTRGTNIEADAAASPAISQTVDGHWGIISGWQSSQSGLFAQLKTLAENMFIKQVDLDASLDTRDLTTAITEVIRQMRDNSDSINASSVSIGSQTGVGTPNGSTVIVLSGRNARGDILQTVFAETIRFATSADSQTGATARQETITVRGAAAVSDPFAYNWPGGSGANTTLSVVDSQEDNSGGNCLYNSDFETFTTNAAEDWAVAVGSAGTDTLAAGSSDCYTGSNALKFTGDGSTLSCIRQTFNQAHSTTVGAGGSPYEVLPSTVYHINCFMKAITSAPSAGVLRIRLVDGSNAVISDDAGNACSFTIDLTALTTSFAAKNGSFRTPSVLPSTVKLEVALSTALTNAKSVVLDDLSMAEAVQLYPGGPWATAHAGDDDTYVGDQWTAAVTNTMGTLAMWLERFFSLREKGLQFPYDGSPTVLDAVIA